MTAIFNVFPICGYKLVTPTGVQYEYLCVQLRGELGVVHSILDNGDLRVSYGPNNWILNPLAVVKASLMF